VVQTVTPAELIALGIPDEEPLDRAVDYTLHAEQQYTGTVDRQQISRIIDLGFESLVIRYHSDLECAATYLTAIGDIYGPDAGRPIFRTEVGLFTLTRRPTEESWPGPMVIYVADYTVGSDEYEQWQIATAPDGTMTEGDFI
jgi:hypothetical protein